MGRWPGAVGLGSATAAPAARSAASAVGAAARALRRIEAALMRRAGLVVLSSPAFAAHYLGPHGQPGVPALLVENKPFARPQAARPDAPAPGGLEAVVARAAALGGGLRVHLHRQ